jgi:signal transduction histidine kinase
MNIRKHSGAQHAVVRFGSSEHSWHLSIEDDGKGFDFQGVMTQDQLEKTQAGPAVIQERVRLIHGTLEIDSNPGRGSAVRIHLAKHTYA